MANITVTIRNETLNQLGYSFAVLGIDYVLFYNCE